MRPLRIVSLLEASTVTGPAGNVIRFCKLARAAGCADLTIAAFHRPGPGESPLASNPFFDAVRAAGIELDIIPEKGRFDRSVVPALREIAARRGADIVETHAVKSHFLVRYAGLHRSCRWVAFQHGYTAEDLKMRLYIQLDRWSLRAASRVPTDCTPFANALAHIGVKRERIEVLPSSIQPVPRPDESEIRRVRQHLGIPDSAKVVLSVGRLSSEKAHADLIQALLLLKRGDPKSDVRLVLVGDGIEKPNLENLVSLSGLASEVIFAGQQRNIWPYYGLADVFALPSLSEGSPNVLLEAMCAGVPIVATSVGGVPETVEDETTALLVARRDPPALAAAIRRILGDPDLAARLTANASIRVVEHFSPQSYCDRLCQIYRTAMGTPLGN